jgi:hypothetical protein
LYFSQIVNTIIKWRGWSRRSINHRQRDSRCIQPNLVKINLYEFRLPNLCSLGRKQGLHCTAPTHSANDLTRTCWRLFHASEADYCTLWWRQCLLSVLQITGAGVTEHQSRILRGNAQVAPLV